MTKRLKKIWIFIRCELLDSHNVDEVYGIYKMGTCKDCGRKKMYF